MARHRFRARRISPIASVNPASSRTPGNTKEPMTKAGAPAKAEGFRLLGVSSHRSVEVGSVGGDVSSRCGQIDPRRCRNRLDPVGSDTPGSGKMLKSVRCEPASSFGSRPRAIPMPRDADRPADASWVRGHGMGARRIRRDRQIATSRSSSDRRRIPRGGRSRIRRGGDRAPTPPPRDNRREAVYRSDSRPPKRCAARAPGPSPPAIRPQ